MKITPERDDRRGEYHQGELKPFDLRLIGAAPPVRAAFPEFIFALLFMSDIHIYEMQRYIVLGHTPNLVLIKTRALR